MGNSVSDAIPLVLSVIFYSSFFFLMHAEKSELEKAYSAFRFAELMVFRMYMPSFVFQTNILNNISREKEEEF